MSNPVLLYRSALRWGCVIGWMALIFGLSAQSSFPVSLQVWGNLQDVAGHLAVYGVLAGLLRWALQGSGARRPGVWAFVLTVLYSFTDEFHQGFVPGRHPDVFDLATDAVGAVAVLWLLQRLGGSIERRSHRSG